MSRTNRLLINDVENCVDEMLEGIVHQNPSIRLLKGHRVIIREDVEEFCRSNRVATICGGGSGHEPFAGGFVGKGMLTAAVAGSVFASPPPNHILAALKAVNSPAGVLVIVANYTGDRLNFGIAVERAKALGIRTDMIVVGEDCALESRDKTAGRRGLVGIVNIMKIAGALAEEGKSLEEIIAVSSDAAKNMGTIGVSLSGCSIPGTGSSFKLDSSQMELGLGAHGEAGVKRMKILSADKTIEAMIDHMTNPENASGFLLKKNMKVSITINNLGGLSELEVHILARKLILLIEEKGIDVERFYNGHLMTSLDMAGLNINIMGLNDIITKALDAETNASAWPRVSKSVSTGFRRVTNQQIELSNNESSNISVNLESSNDTKAMLVAIKKACLALIEMESHLNELDTSAGDGDCGSTLKRGTTEILSKINTWDKCSMADVLLKVAGCAENTMGGASGGLYSLFFTAGSHYAKSNTAQSWLNCLKAGIGAIAKYGGAEPGDRTMLDALVAAQTALEHSLDLEVGDILQATSSAAEKAAKDTANMKAKAGRASYVESSHLTQPDPGATAVGIWLKAIYYAFNEM